MEKHLIVQEIGQYVDALENETVTRLPEEILIHVKECLDCKVEIVEVWN